MRYLAGMLIALGVAQVMVQAMAQPSPAPSARAAEKTEVDLMQQVDFFNALESGDMAAVQSWLSRGMGVNEVQSYGFDQGRTPLIAAATHGNAKLVQFLLQRGAKVNQLNTQRGDFALLEAVKRAEHGREGEADYTATVRLLLQAGADPNQGDSSGHLPLYFAGSTAVMEQLLKAGARPNAPTSRPAFIEHASKADRVALLLKAGANPNVRDVYGETALHRAALDGALEAVQLLLKAMSAEAIAAQGSEGATALDNAARSGNVQVIQALMDRGAQPTQTAWMRAMEQGHLQAARVIGAANQGEVWSAPPADSGPSASGDALSVYAAIAQGQIERARSLYEQSEVKSCGDASLLMHAVDRRNEEAVRALLGLKVDVNYQAPAPLRSVSFVPVMSSSGRPVMRHELPAPCAGMRSVRRPGTALRVAVENQDLAMAQLLVQAGADPALRSFYPPHDSPQSLWQKLHAAESSHKDTAAWRQLLRLAP